MSLGRLKGLPKLKGLATLKDLTGSRRRVGQDDQRQPPPSEAKSEFDLTSDMEDRLASELSDRPLAKRVISLQKKHPYGTVPELLALDYLDRNQERYVYQAQLYGGFRPGGIVPDFLVMRQAAILAMLINGNYWHNLPGMKTADEADKYRLLGTTHEGQRISRVSIVWESRLMRDRDNTMRAALAGQDLGP